jgi:hypothetical protein
MSNFKSFQKEVKVVYPRLVYDIDSLSVYLMTGFNSGTKILQGATGMNSQYPVGEFRTDWYGSDMRDFIGEVTLKGF